MTIEELKELFFGRGQCDSYNKTKKPITKLKWILKQAEKEKIQFAIEVLENMKVETNDLYIDEFDMFLNDVINNKIQELKQYLDEKI